MLFAVKSQMIDCSLKRYTISNVYQGDYFSRNATKDISFKASREIVVTGISLYSLDFNHYECGYQMPAPLEVSMSMGKSFQQSSALFKLAHKLNYKKMDNPEDHNTDEMRLS